jgi:hypothetical protein
MVTLSQSRAFSGFSVNDIQKAKQFYGETLGLKVTEANGLIETASRQRRNSADYPKPNHTRF